MTSKQNSMTILAIDDEHEGLGFACRVLTLEGYTVLQAEHGEECLVLLDLKLPRRDGWSVLADIKGQPQLRKAPVVVFSTVLDHKG